MRKGISANATIGSAHHQPRRIFNPKPARTIKSCKSQIKLSYASALKALEPYFWAMFVMKTKRIVMRTALEIVIKTPAKLTCGSLKKPKIVVVDWKTMKAERRKKVTPTSLRAFLSVELSLDFSFQNLQIRTAPAKSSIKLSKPKASKATLLDSKAAHSATIA